MEKPFTGCTIQKHSSFFFSIMHQLCTIDTYLKELSKKIRLCSKDKQVFSKLSKVFFSSSSLSVEKPKKKDQVREGAL